MFLFVGSRLMILCLVNLVWVCFRMKGMVRGMGIMLFFMGKFLGLEM